MMESRRISKRIEVLPSLNQILISSNGEKQAVSLEDQLMKILLILLERQGLLITKHEFIQAIWEDNKQVGAPALTKNIFKLRKVLKENGIAEELQIETIPKRGYRLSIGHTNSKSVDRRLTPARILPFLLLMGMLGWFPKQEQEHARSKVRVFEFDGADSNHIIQLLRDGSVKRINLDTVQGQWVRLEE